MKTYNSKLYRFEAETVMRRNTGFLVRANCNLVKERAAGV